MTNGTIIASPIRDEDCATAGTAESGAKQHLPGDPGVWLFVLGDMVIFSCYFAAYMFDRGQNHALFMQSQQHLSQNIGVINTLILLTSSLFVALCIQAARAGDFRAANRLLTGGFACGAGFVILKLIEWALKIHAGFTISSNAFFMHYYMMTGLHFFHVLLGLVFLTLLQRELQRKTTPRVQFLEVGATYWHMVDFLWIIIFALAYLMR
jgi:nitric oxide reductase NorE protein